MRPGAASSLLLIDGGGSQGVLRDSHGITAPQFWGPWADTSPSGLTCSDSVEHHFQKCHFSKNQT